MLNAAHLNLTFGQKSSFPLGLVWVVFKNTGLGGGRPRCPSLIIFGEVHHLPLALALRWVEGQLDHPCPRGGGDTHQVGVVPAAAAVCDGRSAHGRRAPQAAAVAPAPAAGLLSRTPAAINRG